MDGRTFDSFSFSKKLVQAGFSQEQTEVLTNLATALEKARIADRDKSEAERRAEQAKLEEERLKVLATKADIERVRAKIKDSEMRLLKWQIGIGIVLVGSMAKGFGWLGF